MAILLLSISIRISYIQWSQQHLMCRGEKAVPYQEGLRSGTCCLGAAAPASAGTGQIAESIFQSDILKEMQNLLLDLLGFAYIDTTDGFDHIIWRSA